MGNSHWSSDAYASFASTTTHKSADDIFTSNRKAKVDSELSPRGIKVRESRDSVAHPLSIAISIWLDVTGSMGRIPEVLVREKLGSLMNTLIDHDIKDSHVMVGAIGDHISDRAPLQVSQYEAGAEELTKWLTKIYIEGNGGGQQKESYLLAWYFAANHTSIDCYEKRNEKGFLFTIGDEATHGSVSMSDMKKIMQPENEAEEIEATKYKKITAKEVLEAASEKYHVFHIHINEGSYKNDPAILKSWRELLGERLIVLNDHENLSELIASTVAVMHGVSLEDATSTFETDVAADIKDALKDVEKFAQHSDDEIVSL